MEQAKDPSAMMDDIPAKSLSMEQAKYPSVMSDISTKASENVASVQTPTDMSQPKEFSKSSSLSKQKQKQQVQRNTGMYCTSDEFFGMLCHDLKAETFAIRGEIDKSPIWICNRDDKVVDVLSGLIKRNILAVPVINKDGKWHGFIDFMDITRYIVNHFGKKVFETERSFWELIAEEKSFATKLVSELMLYPVSLRNVFHPVVAGYSAFSVVEVMAREHHLRRVPIINNSLDRQLVNLVTQSQTIKFMNDNVQLLGPKADKPLSHCTQLFKDVISVTPDSIAFDAFNIMVQKNVSGVAVVDQEGKLCGNLSLRDLKLIGADAAMFWRLHQSVNHFIRRLEWDYESRLHRPKRAIYCLPDAKIGEVIETLCRNEIHRIYICNNHVQVRAIGICSLRDILQEIIM